MTAQSLEGGRSLSWSCSVVGISAGDSVLFGVEVQSLSVGDFPGSLWPDFSIYHLASALDLKGQRFSRRMVSGGDFRRWSILFMVSGFCPEQ